jgi:uncharacterized membrane protein (DUF106 family)
MAFADILNPIFDPLLNFHPFIGIFIVSFIVTLLVTVVYKLTTDQKKMKKLKEDLKEIQNKIKAYAKEGKNDKAMQLQSEAMSKNFEYMKSSFKSTLYTLIPVLIIFGWMSVNIGFHPIAPDQEFTVTAYFAPGHAPEATLSSIPDLTLLTSATQNITYNEQLKEDVATWRVKGQAGEYKLTVNYNEEKYDHTILITEGRKYYSPEKKISDSKLKRIVIGNEKVYPLTIFGLRFTWFWTYIIISILLSLGLRKLMKVY